MANRVAGTVKFFTDKGWGFITPDTGEKDIFVHKEDLANGVTALAEGQKVTYILTDSDRKKKGDGKKAAEVHLV